MKKSLLFLLLGVALFIINTSVAHSAALVVKDFTCIILEENSGLEIPLSTDNGHLVRLPNGNATLICHFEIPEDSIPTETIIKKGFECCLETNLCTRHSMSVASDDGSVLLNCHFKKNYLRAKFKP